MLFCLSTLNTSCIFLSHWILGFCRQIVCPLFCQLFGCLIPWLTTFLRVFIFVNAINSAPNATIMITILHVNQISKDLKFVFLLLGFQGKLISLNLPILCPDLLKFLYLFVFITHAFRHLGSLKKDIESFCNLTSSITTQM